MWSIANEVPEAQKFGELETVQELVKTVKEFEPTRPVTAGINHIHTANETGFLDHLVLSLHLGQQTRDEIAALPGVSDVVLSSTRPFEISIEVSEAALRQYGLTFDDVVLAVRQSSMDLPGGSVKTEAGEILLPD